MQLKRTVKPFGEVNFYPEGKGKARVTATIPIGFNREGAQTGIALDASGSMGENYADLTGRGNNVISPVARGMTSFLASEIDQDGGTTAIYWAMGNRGDQIQLIGDLTAEQAKNYNFNLPANVLGGDTRLLPAVKYFAERFKDAPWGMYVFLTDGGLTDLAEVKQYTLQIAKEIKGGKRNPLKLVLVGVGKGVKKEQMEELDDLTEGKDLPDLWDHKIAADMETVSGIMAEVVSVNARVSKTGCVRDSKGAVVKDYSDTGVPAKIEFEISDSEPYFTLELDGLSFHQVLSDSPSIKAPQSDRLPGEPVIPGVAPGTTFVKELTPDSAKPQGASQQTQSPQKVAVADIADGDFDVSGLSKGDKLADDFDVTDHAKGGDVDLNK